MAPHSVVAARDSSQFDEKPYASSHTPTIVIGSICGVVLVILFIVLIAFHLRRKRNDAQEWPKDPHEMEDYGIEASEIQRPGKAAQPNASLDHLARDINEGRDNPFKPEKS